MCGCASILSAAVMMQALGGGHCGLQEFGWCGIQVVQLRVRRVDHSADLHVPS